MLGSSVLVRGHLYAFNRPETLICAPYHEWYERLLRRVLQAHRAGELSRIQWANSLALLEEFGKSHGLRATFRRVLCEPFLLH